MDYEDVLKEFDTLDNFCDMEEILTLGDEDGDYDEEY